MMASLLPLATMIPPPRHGLQQRAPSVAAFRHKLIQEQRHDALYDGMGVFDLVFCVLVFGRGDRSELQKMNERDAFTVGLMLGIALTCVVMLAIHFMVIR